jgi:hypothetical protein
MNGSPASSRRASAVEIFAICMRERAPSCIRAPPEHEMTMSGQWASSARSTARVTFSPTTLPIEPPMKPYSMTAIMTGMPEIFPARSERRRRAPSPAGSSKAAPRRVWYR